MLYVFYCRKYFCKYVESIKYLLISASLDDGRQIKRNKNNNVQKSLVVDKTWLCNRCTFATRPIKVLFSYFKKRRKKQLGWCGFYGPAAKTLQ